jgi:uncharacterized protein (TIGR01589 family)
LTFSEQVQHLIEKCICYDMDKEECVKALEKHANIMPAVTSTGKYIRVRLQLRIDARTRTASPSLCMHVSSLAICLALAICVHARKQRCSGG